MIPFKKIFQKCPGLYVIAEVATEHWGELDRAKKLVNIARESGAHAVKFQHVIPEEIVLPGSGSILVEGKKFDLYDHFAKVRVTLSFLREVAEYTRSVGIDFLVTAYGVKSLEEISTLSLVMHKVASPELTHPFLLRELQRQQLPLLMSTGVSRWEDILYAKSHFLAEQVCLMQCVTQYPADPKDYNLLAAVNLSQIVSGVMGVSDHTRDIQIIPGLGYGLASLMGKSFVLEKHLTVGDGRQGIDSAVSLYPGEFLQMTKHMAQIGKQAACIKSLSNIEGSLDRDKLIQILSTLSGESELTVGEILGDGVKILTPCEEKIYGTTNRSFFAVKDLLPLTVLTEENTGFYRSEGCGTSKGLDYRFAPQLGTARVKRQVNKGEQLTQEDVELDLKKSQNPIELRTNI